MFILSAVLFGLLLVTLPLAVGGLIDSGAIKFKRRLTPEQKWRQWLNKPCRGIKAPTTWDDDVLSMAHGMSHSREYLLTRSEMFGAYTTPADSIVAYLSDHIDADELDWRLHP